MYGGGVRSCIVLLTVSANSNGQKVAGPSLPGKQGRAGAGGRAKHIAAWSGVITPGTLLSILPGINMGVITPRFSAIIRVCVKSVHVKGVQI